MRKIVITLATVGLMLLGSAAHAAPAPEVRGDLPVRDLHDEMVKKRGKIYFQGRVDPGHGPVIVQKKACASAKCPWRTFKKVPTRGPQERWKVRVPAPRKGSFYWRGYVKAYGGYAKSWTGKWRTYSI